jgi:hypothetical protein
VFVLAGSCGPAALWLPVKKYDTGKIRKAHDAHWRIIRTPQVYQVPCIHQAKRCHSLVQFAKMDGREGLLVPQPKARS